MTVRARLYTFGISHYCEKARWALQWHGLDFDEVRWPPGPHLVLARRLGTVATSVPVLKVGGAVLQGSGAILDWAEQHGRGASLTPAGDMGAAREIEHRADEVLGVHVRRLFYATTLTDHPHLVKPRLFDGVSPGLRLMGEIMWPVTRRKMIEMMDARPEAAADSRAIVESELDWLDQRLAAGDGYLVGGCFNRADLTVASLLAPLARPDEADVYRDLALPERLAEDFARWSERPVICRVKALYRDHRWPERQGVGRPGRAWRRRSKRRNGSKPVGADRPCPPASSKLNRATIQPRRSTRDAGILGEKVGEGSFADVHAWAPGQVVKLFKADLPRRIPGTRRA